MGDSRSKRGLDRRTRRLLLVLGVPTLAMAFATTVVSAYLPVVAKRFTGSTSVIGIVIAGEGLAALFVPLISGSWSDRVRARGGSRLGFVAGALPVVVLALVALGLVSSLLAMGLLVAIFFAATFFGYEPYRALYPDLVKTSAAGRAQGTQAAWRGGGTLLALAGGGVLLSVWRGLPFVIAAVLETAAVVALAVLLPRVADDVRGRRGAPGVGDLRAGLAELASGLRALIGHRADLRMFMVANCLWELSLGAVKTFVVLYVTVGLGHSLAAASLIVGAVAVMILLGALAGGKAADRFGPMRTMRAGVWMYGAALAVPIFVHSAAGLLPVVPFIAFGGGLTMTLPYTILMPLMPRERHGLVTGFYSLSRGLGVMLGPLLAGVAIQVSGSAFGSTHGYAAMWVVASAAILVSAPALGRLRARAQGEHERAQEGWGDAVKGRLLPSSRGR